MTKQNWETLTDKQKRIAVAKDVIKQTESEFLQPITGVYFDYRYGQPQENVDESDTVFAPSEFRTSEAIPLEEGDTCQACAKGGMFLSYFRLNGDPIVTGFRMKDHCDINEDDMMNAMKSVFTELQLDLIESAFELQVYTDPFCEKYPEPGKHQIQLQAIRAVHFGLNVPGNPTDRLKAIMENIIENDGEFIPPEYEDEDQDLVDKFSSYNDTEVEYIDLETTNS